MLLWPWCALGGEGGLGKEAGMEGKVAGRKEAGKGGRGACVWTKKREAGSGRGKGNEKGWGGGAKREGGRGGARAEGEGAR